MTMQICNTIVFIFARQHFVDWKSEIFIGNKKKELLFRRCIEFCWHPRVNL